MEKKPFHMLIYLYLGTSTKKVNFIKENAYGYSRIVFVLCYALCNIVIHFHLYESGTNTGRD